MYPMLPGAQLVEQLTVNQRVVSSSSTRGKLILLYRLKYIFCILLAGDSYLLKIFT